MSDPPIIFRTADSVRITCGGRIVHGTVILASSNGKSLALGFEAMLSPTGTLGGYAGMMPVLWSDERGRFEDLVQSGPVYIDRAP